MPRYMFLHQLRSFHKYLPTFHVDQEIAMNQQQYGQTPYQQVPMQPQYAQGVAYVASSPVTRSGSSEWSHGLCDCCAAGAGTCILAFCLPHIALATYKSEHDGSNCCFNCLCVSAPVANQIVRANYGIQGDCCEDIMVGACCAPCVIVRIAAETQVRGPSPMKML